MYYDQTLVRNAVSRDASETRSIARERILSSRNDGNIRYNIYYIIIVIYLLKRKLNSTV